jgi:hypothetical protein
VDEAPDFVDLVGLHVLIEDKDVVEDAIDFPGTHNTQGGFNQGAFEVELSIPEQGVGAKIRGTVKGPGEACRRNIRDMPFVAPPLVIEVKGGFGPRAICPDKFSFSLCLKGLEGSEDCFNALFDPNAEFDIAPRDTDFHKVFFGQFFVGVVGQDTDDQIFCIRVIFEFADQILPFLFLELVVYVDVDDAVRVLV